MIPILEHLEGVVSSKLSILKLVFSIFKMEAQLARLSVYPLILNVCLLFVVLITLWLSTMVLIGYCTILFFSPLIAVLAIFVLNLLLFLGLLQYFSFNLKNMSFEKTRSYLAARNSDDELEKAIDNSHQPDGKKTALQAKTNKKS